MVEDPKLQLTEHIVDVVKLGSMVCSEVNVMAPQPNDTNNNGGVDEAQNIKENTKDRDASNKV